MPSNKISAEEANARALAGEPLVFVDARSAEAWQKSSRKIPGAIRATADNVAALDGIDPNSTLIVYCT